MVSPYFNKFDYAPEQDLIEDLVVEAISIYGHSMYYCPRELENKDDIYGEDTISEYNSSYTSDFYILDFNAYGGDSTFLAKFNLEIRDEISFSVARRTFMTDIGTPASIERPRESDLIWSPMFKRLMVIKFVDNYDVFYQFGALQTWKVTCEPFEYSNERLNTGIPAVDNIENKYTVSEEYFAMGDDDISIADEDGHPIQTSDFDFDSQMQDTYADNDELEDEAVGIVDWANHDPFSDNSDLYEG